MSGSGHDGSDRARRAPPSPHEPGDVLGLRYELIERLGAGAMGEVWKARHLLLQGLRAVKLIHAAALQDPQFRDRFLQEGQTMMRVRHHAVVEVTDLDEDRERGELYLVMEYLEGRTLRAAVEDAAGPLGSDLRTTARILREVALGMQCVHDEGVVHKDLKSENVILVRGEDGLEHPKVIDFGLAKQAAGTTGPSGAAAGDARIGDSQAGTTLAGTLPYMAPEMFLGLGSSSRSDIYAFGVMGFECLCRGELPISLTSLAEYMHHHRAGRTPQLVAERRTDVDSDLAEILDRCLAPRPEDRPPSFREIADDLGRWLDAPERARRRRKTLLALAAAATSVGLAVWALLFAGTTASIGRLSVSAGDELLVEQPDHRVHVGADDLSDLRLAARLQGRPAQPVLEIDGRSRAMEAELEDGMLSARVDLSDLPDGQHEIAVRPAEDAAPTSVVLEVDRAAPVIEGVRLDGVAGAHSRAASPRVLVTLAEPHSRIAGVVAVAAGGAMFEAQRHPSDDRTWVLVGTSASDGEVELFVAARDLAGNEAHDRFVYERDTVAPECRVTDLVGGDGGVLQVRQALGASLRLTSSEAAHVEVRVDGILTSSEDTAPGATVFQLPAIPADGAPVSLRVADAAGNERRLQFTVRHVPDEIVITDKDGGDRGVVPAGTDVHLVTRSAYPLQRDPRISARRVRDASGEPSPGADPVPVDATVSDVRDEDRTCDVHIAAGRLPPGTWAVSFDGEAGAVSRPYELTVDAGEPVVESVRILDENGDPPDATGFVRTPGVVIDVVVTDQSLSRIELDGAPPDAAPGPGRRTYRFVRACEREGDLTWTLGLGDAAGHTNERSVKLRADWTVPTLRLTEPVDGGSYDDFDLVRFVGTCSEAPVRLSVRVGADKALEEKAVRTTSISELWRLPAGDPLSVDVFASDDAGHVSEPVRLRLRVMHRASELPLETSWSRGVTATMQRVDAGDVLVQGHIATVGMLYVDRAEVTNAQYRAFLGATSATRGHGAWCHADEPESWEHVPDRSTWEDPRWNADELPVVNVGWWDAHAFAAWSGRRLPTDAEWVRAATRGRAGADAVAPPRAYPPFPRGEWRDGVLATCEVTDGKGPLPALEGEDVSPNGCLHMGGNVSEWIAADPDAGPTAHVRGGNWFLSSAAADVAAVPAKTYVRSLRANTIGFRCATVPEERQR